ncbi:MAG: DUF932 domain-containing protein [Desulfurellales bacterium]|nr:MAG: DUF932 domain-containing protein [Desulfurellales bacterium]
MKAGKTLMELAAEVQRQSTAKADFVAVAGALKMVGGELEIPTKGSFELNENAHDQLGSYLGIPSKYYDRMRVEAPALLATNVNRWLAESEDKRMIRTLDGKVRAVLSDKYRPLDNEQLLETILPVLGNQQMEIQSCEVTEKKLYLKVLTPKIQYEIVKGDVVQAGLVISNSEIGGGSLSIEPLLYRLVCTNGLIANDSKMRKYHVGRGNDSFGAGAIEYFRDETRLADDRAFWFKVRDLVSGAIDQINFSKLAESFFATKEDKITADPVQVVEIFSKQNALNQTEKNGVLAHLLGGGELNRFGLMNAVTRYSQDVESYDRATQFEKLGGAVLELPRSEWKSLNEQAMN